MERLVVVWCPSLVSDGERGDEVRTFGEILEAAGNLCPWVEPVRLGVGTLPARGPSRFFGGERAMVEELTGVLAEVAGLETKVRIGIADGLFAAVLAARSEVIVGKGDTPAFLAPWSVAVLGRPELASTLDRLGIRTLGQFADLPVRHVLSRFGGDGAACHRVARGEDGELAGERDPGMARRLREVSGPVIRPVGQPGFFGGTSEGEARAAASFASVQRNLGTEEVVVARLRGGRHPAERGHLLPWGSRPPAAQGDGRGGRRSLLAGEGASGSAPWPGRIPSPAPITVLATPVRAELVGEGGQPVRVSARGLFTEDPAHLSVGGEAWRGVEGWSGPWPSTERWWAAHRHRTRVQVVTAPGPAVLLAAERGQWWLEATYD